MASISAANVVTFTDDIANAWDDILTGQGTGSTAASSALGTLLTDILATADYDVTHNLDAAAYNAKNAANAYACGGAQLGQIFQQLSLKCAAAGISGVTDLDSFATYYNLTAVTKWQCLFAPVLRDAYCAWKTGAAPAGLSGSVPTAYNVFLAILQGASFTNADGTSQTFTNALGQFVASGAGVGTYSAPSAGNVLIDGSGTYAGATAMIDWTKFAGGYAYCQWSGGSGSGTLTVAGVWRKADGTVATGNGTISISGASSASPGTVMTPPFSNALLLGTTNITIAAGITAGTFYINAKAPASRTNAP